MGRRSSLGQIRYTYVVAVQRLVGQGPLKDSGERRPSWIGGFHGNTTVLLEAEISKSHAVGSSTPGRA
eukprot:15472194-Alexandrium_andersonii.AAC.1